MDVQFQIRQNAMEMQEYMKDLFDWENSIKKKERALASSTGISNSQPSTTPAPRGRASGAVAPPAADLMQPALGPKPSASMASKTPSDPNTKQSGESTQTKRNAAAHTYTSYGKWDKFDVDAALVSDGDDDDDDDDDEPVKDSSKRGIQSSGATTSQPSSSSSRSDLPKSGQSISITARDPSVGPTEDLLKPVATTRLSKLKPPADSTAAIQQDTAAATAPAAAAAAAAAVTAPLPPIRNSQPSTADAWRARGNDLFKAGEYGSAYECYSRSVELQPTCLGHANRAMALLKLGRWQEAVEDCTRAIDLDPGYVKAYQRRAAAHRQLGSLLEAARDWEQALRLEPDNRATAADRDASLEQLLAEQKLQPPSRRVAVSVDWVLLPPPLQPPSSLPPAPSPLPQPQLPALQPQLPAQQQQQQPPSIPAPATVAMASSAVDCGDSQPHAAEPTSQHQQQQHQQQQLAATSTVMPPGAAVATTREAVTTCAQAAIATAAASATVPAGVGTLAAGAKGIPRTSVEFEAAWRGLAGDLRGQAVYLGAIPPTSLPSIFKNSLTAPVLTSIVRCLLSGMAPGSADVSTSPSTSQSATANGTISPAQGVALLEGLTRVARFDLMAMSVPSRERQELRAAWEALLEQLRNSAEAGGPAAPPSLGPVEGGEGTAVTKALQAVRQKYRV